MIKKFNHVGVAVKDLERALSFFQETFGAELVWRARYEEEGIESVCIAIGEAHFELIGSLDAKSLIARFIESRGEGIHHVSLQTDDFDKTIESLKAKGMKIVSERDTTDFKAAFIHPTSSVGVLTEIIEPKPGGMMDPQNNK